MKDNESDWNDDSLLINVSDKKTKTNLITEIRNTLTKNHNDELIRNGIAEGSGECLFDAGLKKNRIKLAQVNKK
jgi:hypothetical protein